MERIVMRPLGAAPQIACWHCGQPIDQAGGSRAGRYMYRGDQPLTAIIEDWIHCGCGAYQNVRRLTEITVEPVGNT
jgi:sarcosine oxidase delta subunit